MIITNKLNVKTMRNSVLEIQAQFLVKFYADQGITMSLEEAKEIQKEQHAKRLKQVGNERR